MRRRGLPVKHLLCNAGNPDIPARAEIARGFSLQRHNGKPVEKCNHSLLGGRSCGHVKGSPRIVYEPCPYKEEKCNHGHAIPGTIHRHSHTWQQGDARYEDTDGKRIDMETGEVVGNTEGIGEQLIREIIEDRGIYHRKPELNPDMPTNARRVLEMQYGATTFDDTTPVRTLPRGVTTGITKAISWRSAPTQTGTTWSTTFPPEGPSGSTRSTRGKKRSSTPVDLGPRRRPGSSIFR